MSHVDAVGAFVRRLEDRIAEDVGGRDQFALAYSGGLASTLVAAIARKRCDLECIVAGAAGSPDVEAAKVAKDSLDFRVEYVLLNSTRAHQIRERIASADPNLPPHAVDALIPLRAAAERAHDRPLMCGFGWPRLPDTMSSALQRIHVSAPLHAVGRSTPLSRARLRAAATALGLPIAWSRMPRRTPAEGSGIDTFLHEKARRTR